MSIRVNTTRTKIFSEFTDEERKYYFDLKHQKYVHHIDTFYYSISIKDDKVGNSLDGVFELIEILEEFKQKVQDCKEDIYFNMENDILFRNRRFSIYEYCIGKEGFFDIFIAKSIPNDLTPRIVVQLRSIGLWTQGEYKLIHETYDFVSSILKECGLEIWETKENRIDYAYHTNAIQSPMNFFNDDVLSNNLETTFSIYSKVGRKNNKHLTVEYLSLGNRKSNNLFFRSYNKVREVIEENYKEFFIQYWLDSGLINRYDYEIYTFAYKKKRYDSIEWAKLDFYLKHGKDPYLKGKCIEMLKNESEIKIDDLRKIFKGVLPEPTLIMNIEFQTQRKFYKSSDKFIEFLPFRSDISINELVRLFQIIDNRKIFLDYLTSTTVAFKKDGQYMDFWKRLRACKVDKVLNIKLKREYVKNINVDLIKKRLKSNLATLSLYTGNDDTDINDDMSLLLCILNDNDMKVDENGLIKYDDEEYIRIKDKKKKALKSIINNNISSPSNQ